MRMDQVDRFGSDQSGQTLDAAQVESFPSIKLMNLIAVRLQLLTDLTELIEAREVNLVGFGKTPTKPVRQNLGTAGRQAMQQL